MAMKHLVTLVLAAFALAGCAMQAEPSDMIRAAHADAQREWSVASGVHVSVNARIVDSRRDAELVAAADAGNGGAKILGWCDMLYGTGVYYIQDRIEEAGMLAYIDIIALHEVGHCLGLPHSYAHGAVMALDGLARPCITEADAAALDYFWGREPGTAVSTCE